MCGGDVMVESTVLPIFRDYEIGFLAKRLRRKVSYLSRMMDGYETPGEKFKGMAADLLNKTVEELFGEIPD